jgi:hypothetical protein
MICMLKLLSDKSQYKINILISLLAGIPLSSELKNNVTFHLK